MIGAENITFPVHKGTYAILKCFDLGYQELIPSTDAQFFCSVVEAAKSYFFCRDCDHVNIDDFRAFILITAVKNKCKDEIIRLMKNPISSRGFRERNGSEILLTVASTLASQFIENGLDNGLYHDFMVHLNRKVQSRPSIIVFFRDIHLRYQQPHHCCMSMLRRPE